MPNIAAVLKSEIARLARREIKGEIGGLKKALPASRTELVSLRQRVSVLESAVKKLSRVAASKSRPVRTPKSTGQGESALRFRAAGMAANRKRLGLSAAEFGSLVGASAQTIYNWEAGNTRPAAESLAAIASLRNLGKRKIQARLAALK